MTRAEEQALKAYPNIKIGEQHIDQSPARDVYVQGYEQAEKDLRKELFRLGLSSNPMDYIKWVEEKIKELEK